MKAYVFVDVKPGEAAGAAKRLTSLQGVVAVDAVTGAHDIIVTCEVPRLAQLSSLVFEMIQSDDAVRRTITCLVIS